MTTATLAPPTGLIRWHYAWYAIAALAVMVAAIVSHDRWVLDFVHLFAGLLWTGADLFLGFVMGPILRSVDVSVRREIAMRLVPRTLFLMPTVAIITGTTGWYLAVQVGYAAMPWPQYGWVAAALVLVTLMTIQGLGLLTPINVRVCLLLQRPDPDLARISRLMRYYFLMVAIQGSMQVLMIVVMARFGSGI